MLYLQQVCGCAIMLRLLWVRTGANYTKQYAGCSVTVLLHQHLFRRYGVLKKFIRKGLTFISLRFLFMLPSLLAILLGIAAIILLTTRFGMHPFFALLLACFITGLGIQMPVAEIITTGKEGFGTILKALGFIVVLGTTLGVVLEHTGGTQVLASFLLQKVGDKNAPLAMSLTGFFVGLPIFCDSGYIVLSGLNKALVKRTNFPAVVLATTMATGLYAVHCLIPPHPGATAAAAAIGVDYGRLMLVGTAVAVPAMLVGYGWARYAGRNITFPIPVAEEKPLLLQNQPGVINAFLPVIIPVLLIALKSFFTLDTTNTASWFNKFLVLGDPVIALMIGMALAFYCKSGWKKAEVNKLLAASVEKAGSILVIIGAGGAFGAVLAATKIGTQLNGIAGLPALGLLVPFLLTSVLKTAQGSSTVAIITAASIVQPLLPALGLTTETEKLLAVLSMGAGSMMVSHANDAYFWVIAKFSDLPVKPLLKVYSMATVLMALTSFLVICLIYMLQ